MTLPDFDEESGYLPGGTHDASMSEVAERYAYNFRRREILKGLQHVLELLAARGVQQVWLDGSFVTNKQRPSDVDVIYVPPPGADTSAWDWVSPARRPDLKKHHRVDLWQFPSPQPPKKFPVGHTLTIKQFFESDADDLPKGIVNLIGWVDDQE